jgi:hypothetical protein
MKTWKLTLISLTILASLVLGAFVFEVFSAGKTARVKAWFYPRTYTLDNPVPEPWNVELRFAPPRSVDEVDTSTILLEGRYSPSSEPYDRKNVVVVPFDGYDVLEAAILKLVHMGPLTPGSHQVFLEVTGLLKDGTPFNSGMSGCIIVFVPDCPPP